MSVPASVIVRRFQVECDVGDHVFLSADESAFADLEEDGAHVDAVLLRGGFGVTEEVGDVHAELTDLAVCCADTSASVQCVAIRMERHRDRDARSRIGGHAQLADGLIERGFDMACSYKKRTAAPFPHAILNTQLFLDYANAGAEMSYPFIPMTVNCDGQHAIARKGGLARFTDIELEVLDPSGPTPARCLGVVRPRGDRRLQLQQGICRVFAVGRHARGGANRSYHWTVAGRSGYTGQ